MSSVGLTVGWVFVPSWVPSLRSFLFAFAQ